MSPLPDALADVAVGQPHVPAHNAERAAINALLADHVAISDLTGKADASALANYVLTSDLATDIEDALEDYSPGTTAAYAKVTSNLTTTGTTYPGTPLAGLALSVVGNGRPVEIVLVLPGISHSVANVLATVEVTVNSAGLGANNMLAGYYLPPVATKTVPLNMAREITIPDGVTWNFAVNAYASGAGTLTFTGAIYAPMELKAIRR